MIAENFEQRAKDLMTNFHATHKKKDDNDLRAMLAKHITWNDAAKVLRAIADGKYQPSVIDVKARKN